ncbi:MAG: hypothetical protein ASARMPRED_008926 [Alectoria sarmentosa]|nr:MAG: hypothetical protein ASARMPRED_008926 [Alectoria sarmentosa]
MASITADGVLSSSKIRKEGEVGHKCFFPSLSEAQPGSGQWLKTAIDLEGVDLRGWCESYNSNLGALFKAVWAIVLARYVGIEHVCFWFYNAAEEKRRLSVVSLRLESTTSIESLLREVEVGDASSNSPFVVGRPNDDRGGEGAAAKAFCNTCLCFFNEGQSSDIEAKGQFESENEQCSAENDIVLSVNASQEAIHVALAHSSSIMSKQQAVHLGFAVSEGLRSATVLGLQSSSRDIDLFHHHHVKQVDEWNRFVPRTIHACAYEAIWQQIAERPTAQAICSWDGNLTYAELGQLSDQLAQQMASLGVGPEVLVPICFHKSKWAVVAMLGVMKAGGAFVPLSPFDPRKHLETIIQDVGARFILADIDAADLFGDIIDRVFVVPPAEKLATASDDCALPVVSSENIAYVIYTSGSTGIPKGVLIEHRALSTNMKHLGAAFGLSRVSRVYQFSSYTFDVAVLDIFVTLAAGGCICIPSEDQRANNVEAMNRMNVTLAILTPSIARTIDPESLETLETLIFGGEAVGRSDVSQWAKKVRLINAYGPTECCIACNFNTYAGIDSRPDVIGRAVGSTSWVVEPDNHEFLAPVGAVGELVVQGGTLARGYLHNREKTEMSFVLPKWLSESTSKRVYKTGDLVRYTDDGRLVYLGRKDTQVKLHGQRIEVGEIEHHIISHPLVKNALVLLADIRKRIKGLVSVVVMCDDSSEKARGGLHLVNIEQGFVTAQVNVVHDYVSKRVPTHMIPTMWLVVENFPHLPSAKVDRKAVARWVANLEGEISAHNALRAKRVISHHSITPMESKLQGVIAQVLNLDLDEVSMNQSFPSMGGDSIAAMEVQSRCRDEGIKILYQHFMRSRSIAELAQVATVESKDTEQILEEQDAPFLLSPIQQFYFDQPRLPTRFHSSVYLQILKDTDSSSIASAIERVAGRHSQLRARFKKTAEGWQQSIVKYVPGSYSFKVHEIDDEARTGKLVAARQGELDILEGPIFAATLFNVQPGGKKLLSLMAHHLIVDLVSWRIILHDLELLLSSRPLSGESSFPFWRWCELQMEKCQELTPPAVLLDDIPPANMDYWELRGQSNNLGDALEEHFELNSQQTILLLRHCVQVLNAEAVDVFLAAALYSFGQIFLDRALPTFYCENHGREAWDEEVDLSGTVGWFNTLVPLNLGVQRLESIEDTVRRVRTAREKIPGQGQPYFAYRCLHLNGREAFGEHLNMEIFFNYTGYRQLEGGSSLLRHKTLNGQGTEDIGSATRRLALLDVLVDINGGCLVFTFLHNRHTKHQEKVRRWVEECQRCLKALVGDTRDG